MHVDLHCHSTASDGECVPTEVARRAQQAGLSAIALTDHDTTDGVAAAADEGARLGVRVVPGCEFSVKAPWGELHLLGYFLPLGDAALEAFLRETRAARRRRGEQIVAKLQGLGVPIALSDVDAQAQGGAVGRPHVARALVAREALSEVAELLHSVGAVAVAAHLGDHGTEGQLRQFQEQGLDGLEVRHPSHAPSVEQRLTRIAARLGLGISGGSDWHGDTEFGGNHAPLGGMHIPLAWLELLEQRRSVSGLNTRTSA